MTTATADRTGTDERTSARAVTACRPNDLRVAHLAAAAAVAALDFDRPRWRRVDRTVAELTASTYRLTAAVTGARPAAVTGARPAVTPPRPHLPPVVRVRMLAAAQQQLFAALDRHPVPDPALLGPAIREVRTAIDAVEAAQEPPDRR